VRINHINLNHFSQMASIELNHSRHHVVHKPHNACLKGAQTRWQRFGHFAAVAMNAIQSKAASDDRQAFLCNMRVI
jgi:hypothetical protein